MRIIFKGVLLVCLLLVGWLIYNKYFKSPNDLNLSHENCDNLANLAVEAYDKRKNGESESELVGEVESSFTAKLFLNNHVKEFLVESIGMVYSLQGEYTDDYVHRNVYAECDLRFMNNE